MAQSNTGPLYPRYLLRKSLALSWLQRYRFLLPPQAEFLEIGGGRGDFSQALLRMFPRGVVLDFSAEAVASMRLSLANQNVEVLQANILKYSPPRTFSFIAMLEVLEHIKEDRASVAKLHSLLAANGLLLLSVPARMKYWGTSDEAVGHYRRYEKQELLHLLESEGFHVLQCASYGFPVLNLIAFARNAFFAKVQDDHTASRKETRSEKSGLGYVQTGMFHRIVGLLFSRPLLHFWLLITRPFHLLDLGDGYLVLLHKGSTTRKN